MPIYSWVLRVICLTALLLSVLKIPVSEASVVSRLGDVYFYDPLSFDAGVLQRGLGMRGGADTAAGDVEAWLDLPFYRDFSLRGAYIQRVYLDAPDGRDFTWRFRMPIYEMARFGRIASTQAVYAGSTSIGQSADLLLPNHIVGAAHSFGRTVDHVAHSMHGQALFVVRERGKVAVPLDQEKVVGGRVGVNLKAAHLMQVYEPAWGPGGKWTVTVSTVEANVVHYGGLPGRGGAGRLEMIAAAPAINFTPSSATYTLGVMPRLVTEWGHNGVTTDVGALAMVSISYRTHLE